MPATAIVSNYPTVQTYPTIMPNFEGLKQKAREAAILQHAVHYVVQYVFLSVPSRV